MITRDRRMPDLGRIFLLRVSCGLAIAAWLAGGLPADTPAAAEPATAPAATTPKGKLLLPLERLAPKGAEYGTRPDPNDVQKHAGPGVIDTTPLKPINNATWFWPKALKVVTDPPPEDFELPEGKPYSSAQTKIFASEGFFVTGVGLWGRTRNMYHWVEYDIPPGAARFTGEVLITDDPLGWFAGQRGEINQQFEFIVEVDGKRVAKKGETRMGKGAGSGEKLMDLDIPLAPAAKTIRFSLEITPWGDGNKNVELVITEGLFKAAAE